MPLSQIPNGKKATVVSIRLPESGINRLTALGLIPGARVRVVDNSRPDTSLIECKGVRLALGRGLSRFVEVQ